MNKPRYTTNPYGNLKTHLEDLREVRHEISRALYKAQATTPHPRDFLSDAEWETAHQDYVFTVLRPMIRAHNDITRFVEGADNPVH